MVVLSVCYCGAKSNLTLEWTFDHPHRRDLVGQAADRIDL
jgi:hypothetical protein